MLYCVNRQKRLVYEDISRKKGKEMKKSIFQELVEESIVLLKNEEQILPKKGGFFGTGTDRNHFFGKRFGSIQIPCKQESLM